MKDCREMSEAKRKFDLEERLIDFAVRIIKLAESLLKTRVGNHISGQLIRCGTSPAPNYGEAQSAESKADFIHKMSIGLKEANETDYWLRLLHEGQYISDAMFESIRPETKELIKLLVRSIKTAKQNIQSRQ